VIIGVSGATTGNTVKLTLTEGVWGSYSVTASSLGVTASQQISGVQFQAYGSQINQNQVTFQNLSITNAACGQTASQTASNGLASDQSSGTDTPNAPMAGLVVAVVLVVVAVIVIIVVAVICVMKKRVESL